jgi:hypothetical protein
MRTQRPVSFRQYIHTRRYDYGRGGKSRWPFLIHALGDPNLPDAHCWAELRDHLTRSGCGAEMLKAGKIVWRSYIANLSVRRRASGHLGGAQSAPTHSLLPETGRQEQECAD